VPQPVIARAREVLATLEQLNVSLTERERPAVRHAEASQGRPAPIQLTLFSAVESPTLQRLKGTRDSMSSVRARPWTCSTAFRLLRARNEGREERIGQWHPRTVDRGVFRFSDQFPKRLLGGSALPASALALTGRLAIRCLGVGRRGRRGLAGERERWSASAFLRRSCCIGRSSLALPTAACQLGEALGVGSDQAIGCFLVIIGLVVGGGRIIEILGHLLGRGLLLVAAVAIATLAIAIAIVAALLLGLIGEVGLLLGIGVDARLGGGGITLGLGLVGLLLVELVASAP
jgi:hypothetical protein